MPRVSKETLVLDMERLQNSIRMCMDSIKNYENAKVVKRSEQQDLQILVRNPGIYSIEALKRNVENCNDHIAEFDKVINNEKNAIKAYQKIYNELQIDLNNYNIEEIKNGDKK